MLTCFVQKGSYTSRVNAIRLPSRAIKVFRCQNLIHSFPSLSWSKTTTSPSPNVISLLSVCGYNGSGSPNFAGGEPWLPFMCRSMRVGCGNFSPSLRRSLIATQYKCTEQTKNKKLVFNVSLGEAFYTQGFIPLFWKTIRHSPFSDMALYFAAPAPRNYPHRSPW